MVDGTCPCHYGYDARVEIVCGNGVFHIGGTQEPSVARLQRDGRLQGKTVKSWFQLFKDAYVAELEHFVHCVVEDAEPRVTGLDGLKAVEAAAAANESILQGRPVEILRESEILRE
jgi:predicted dehydrogenase